MKKNDKIVFGLVVAVIIAAFFMGRCNGVKSVVKKVGVDTTITVTKTDTIYQPGVTTTITHTNTKWYSIHDTLEIEGDPHTIIMVTDTAAILADWNTTRFYRDSQNLKRGSVIISDSVTHNRITSRRLETLNTDTTIVKTVTLIPPRKMVVYFGIDYLGSPKQPFYAAGANLSLKLPSERQYLIGAMIDKNGKIVYQAGVRFPIRLRKP